MSHVVILFPLEQTRIKLKKTYTTHKTALNIQLDRVMIIASPDGLFSCKESLESKGVGVLRDLLRAWADQNQSNNITKPYENHIQGFG